MPFPINLESLLAAGYVFLRSETCPACQEPVEVFTTPGKRELRCSRCVNCSGQR